MEQIARRNFCGTALLAFPLLGLAAKDADNCVDSSDPLMDLLIGEFTKTTADGSQNGFKAEHYRQYASLVRVFDARLESKGTNGELNKRLDEDDFHQLNPARIAKAASDYWQKHGIAFNENDLAARFSFDRAGYDSMKKAIKQQGGVRALHASIAESFERRARELGSDILRDGPAYRDGRIMFPSTAGLTRPSRFMKIQYDFDIKMFVGLNLDCLCRAMITEAALLSLACVIGIVAFCEPAAFLMALEKLMEDVLRLCDPDRC